MSGAIKRVFLFAQLILLIFLFSTYAVAQTTVQPEQIDSADSRLKTLVELMDDPLLRERLKNRINELPIVSDTVSNSDGIDSAEKSRQITPILEKIRSRARQLEQARLNSPQLAGQWSDYWKVTLAPVDL